MAQTSQHFLAGRHRPSAMPTAREVPGKSPPPRQPQADVSDDERNSVSRQQELFELRFGELLGEDPLKTRAKILARRSSPDLTMVDVEKEVGPKGKKELEGLFDALTARKKAQEAASSSGSGAMKAYGAKGAASAGDLGLAAPPTRPPEAVFLDPSSKVTAGKGKKAVVAAAVPVAARRPQVLQSARLSQLDLPPEVADDDVAVIQPMNVQRKQRRPEGGPRQGPGAAVPAVTTGGLNAPVRPVVAAARPTLSPIADADPPALTQNAHISPPRETEQPLRDIEAGEIIQPIKLQQSGMLTMETDRSFDEEAEPSRKAGRRSQLQVPAEVPRPVAPAPPPPPQAQQDTLKPERPPSFAAAPDGATLQSAPLSDTRGAGTPEVGQPTGGTRGDAAAVLEAALLGKGKPRPGEAKDRPSTLAEVARASLAQAGIILGAAAEAGPTSSSSLLAESQEVEAAPGEAPTPSMPREPQGPRRRPVRPGPTLSAPAARPRMAAEEPEQGRGRIPVPGDPSDWSEAVQEAMQRAVARERQEAALLQALDKGGIGAAPDSADVGGSSEHTDVPVTNLVESASAQQLSGVPGEEGAQKLEPASSPGSDAPYPPIPRLSVGPSPGLASRLALRSSRDQDRGYVTLPPKPPLRPPQPRGGSDAEEGASPRPGPGPGPGQGQSSLGPRRDELGQVRGWGQGAVPSDFRPPFLGSGQRRSVRPVLEGPQLKALKGELEQYARDGSVFEVEVLQATSGGLKVSYKGFLAFLPSVLLATSRGVPGFEAWCAGHASSVLQKAAAEGRLAPPRTEAEADAEVDEASEAEAGAGAKREEGPPSTSSSFSRDLASPASLPGAASVSSPVGAWKGRREGGGGEEERMEGSSARMGPSWARDILVQEYKALRLRIFQSMIGTSVKVVVAHVHERGTFVLSEKGAEKKDPEDAAHRVEVMNKLQIGQTVQCRVVNLMRFGAVVATCGTHAFINFSDTPWPSTRLGTDGEPTAMERLKLGTELEARVSRLDFANSSIYLTLTEVDVVLEALDQLLQRRPFCGEVELEGVLGVLRGRPEVSAVTLGVCRASAIMAPAFQIYLSSPVERGYKLLALSQNEQQEIYVETPMAKENMKDLIQQAISALESLAD